MRMLTNTTYMEKNDTYQYNTTYRFMVCSQYNNYKKLYKDMVCLHHVAL